MPKQPFNFEQAYQELEKIVSEFESGEIDLDLGLKKFERGLELASELKKRLSEVENKVIEIKKKFGEGPKSSEEEQEEIE